MEVSNSVVLPLPRQKVWDALNDPAILKQCISGCESIDPTGENQYAVSTNVAVGPVRARFKGKLELADIDAPNAYVLRFDGQGGVAGFGKGTAKVTLADEDGGTRLTYSVSAQIGGKIAQLGSRLVDGAARKMADEFFAAFNAVVVPAQAPTEVAAPVAAAPAGRVPWWVWLLVFLAIVLGVVFVRGR